MSRPVLLSISVLLAGLSSYSLVHAADLSVTVKGVNNDVGVVGCALFNKEEGFAKSASAIAMTGEKAKPSGNLCVFRGLAAGTYAVAVIHDINNNKKMDSSALGFPTEDWGMSNNVRPSLRAPTFKESSFAVDDAPVQITVSISR